MESVKPTTAWEVERRQLAEAMRESVRTQMDLWKADQSAQQTRHAELLHMLGEQVQAMHKLAQRQMTEPNTSAPVGASFGEPIRLNKLAPEDDIEDFLLAFERVAGASHWPQDQWAIKLIPCLAGRALEAYRTLNTEQASDYKCLKEVLLEYLGHTPEQYRMQFRALKMEPGERPKALAQRLKRLCERWLTPFLQSLPAVIAELVREQFMEAVPGSLRDWLARQGAPTLGQTVAIAEAFLEAQDPSRNQGSRRTPWEETSRVRGSSHTTPSRYNQSTSRDRTFRCFSCGKMGHRSTQCKGKLNLASRKESPGPREGREYFLPVRVGGVPATALLDSGANQSSVSRALWRAHSNRSAKPDGTMDLRIQTEAQLRQN
uniref:Uncharacterized protein LOC117363993 n=1 Tax=Geotrypetes seraphini TaxID=260995 RepID=A0A6P8RTK0_GEOSA|nr:uncharacterized protein LOC117363993 [Geotrypetes seraphini]